MKKFLLAISVLGLVSCSSATKQPELAKAAPPAPTPNQDVAANKGSNDSNAFKKETCASENDKRYLEIRKKDKGCELSYTKGGKEKIVATGRFGTKHCENSLEKITRKLETDHFICQENQL